MIDDIKKYVNFLCDLEITEHQFLILWLVSTKDEDTIRAYKLGKGDFRVDEIIDLIDRGYLEDFGTIKDGVRNFNIYDFLVTDKFTKSVIVDKDDAVEELLAVHPKWFNIKGTKVPAITYDIDKLGKLYFQYHKGNRLKHEKVVQITKDYYSRPGYEFAQKKIEDYISGRLWILFEEEVQAHKGGDIGFKTY